MRAYVITIPGNDYSEKCAVRCIRSAAQFGIEVEPFDAVTKDTSRELMEHLDLHWAWPNVEADVCPLSGLKRHPYRTKDPRARAGCSMSHYMLWKRCVELQEPILILEHDAVFLRGLPELPSEFGAVMLNNPGGATPKGFLWKMAIEEKGLGVHPKTVVFEDGRPDGLAGNSAYVISPKAALRCIELYHELGVWPNDATLCRQLVDGLMEVYPFVTEVQQSQSTSGGY